jgi:hypothetical protein
LKEKERPGKKGAVNLIRTLDLFRTVLFLGSPNIKSFGCAKTNISAEKYKKMSINKKAIIFLPIYPSIFLSP